MALDWSMVRNDLADDPAVILIAGSLKVDPDLVVGKLLRVWAWAGDHTTTGLVRNAAALVIDHIARCDGFAKAMATADWLELRADNTVFFPRWQKWNSNSARRRGLDQRRKSRERLQNVRKVSASKADKSVTKGKERKGEDISGGKPPETPNAVRSAKPRARNVLFDALAQAFYPSGYSKRIAKAIGGCAADLKAMQAAPDEIESRRENLSTLRGHSVTMHELVKAWNVAGSNDDTGLVECGPADPDDPRLKRGVPA